MPRCSALAWLAFATTAVANPVFVYLNPTVVWSTPFPFVPSTIAGEWNVWSSQPYGASGRFSFIGVDPTAGSLHESRGPYVVEPGTTLYWQFSAIITAGDGYGNTLLPLCAYADFATPVASCDVYTPPVIEIGTFADQDFIYNLGGAIFAFADGVPVQVGTWTIRTDGRMVPEPGTLLLLVVAMVALALRRTGGPAARFPI